MASSRSPSTRVLLFSSIALTLLLLETVPRLSPKLRPVPTTYVGEYRNKPSESLVEDPLTGWKMKPLLRRRVANGEYSNDFRSNAQGYRSRLDFDQPQPAPVIALAGDSFTQGVGVEIDQTFGSLLDQGLANAVVYNFGMVGYGLDQMWLTARHYALPHKPRLLIISLISESFIRSLQAYRLPEGWNKPVFRVDAGRLVRKTSSDRPNFLFDFFDNHSVLFRFALLGSRMIGQYVPHGELWNLNAAMIRQIEADCKLQNVPVVFVYIPTYYWRSFPALHRFMDHEGLNFIDLSTEPGLDRQKMYFPGDGHLNVTGHAHVANVLLKWVRREMPQLQ